MPDIFGIKLTDIKEKEAIEKIFFNIEKNIKSYAVTPNPEIILKSLKDEKLFNILNKADFSFADGVGIKLALLSKGKKINRITGADLSKKIIKLAEVKNIKIGVITWDKGLSSKEDIGKSIHKEYPQLKLSVWQIPRNEYLEERMIKEINKEAPQILFVAIGFPQQEKLIYNHLKDFKTVNFAIGVGGTFDFITKKAKRAPRIIRKLGLEWLFRLIIQPTRIKRIFEATFVFIFKFIKYNYGKSRK